MQWYPHRGRFYGDESVKSSGGGQVSNSFNVTLNIPDNIEDSRKPSAVYAQIKDETGNVIDTVILKKEDNYTTKVENIENNNIQVDFICNGLVFEKIEQEDGNFIANVSVPSGGYPIEINVILKDIDNNLFDSYTCKYDYSISYMVGADTQLMKRFSVGDKIFSGNFCLGYASGSNGSIRCSKDYSVLEGNCTTVISTPRKDPTHFELYLRINKNYCSKNGVITGTHTILGLITAPQCYADIYLWPELDQSKDNGLISDNLVKSVLLTGVVNTSTNRVVYEINLTDLDDSKRYRISIRVPGYIYLQPYIENGKMTSSYTYGTNNNMSSVSMFPKTDGTLIVSSKVLNGTSSSAPTIGKNVNYILTCKFKNSDGVDEEAPITKTIANGTITFTGLNPMYVYAFGYTFPENKNYYHRTSFTYSNGSGRCNYIFNYHS